MAALAFSGRILMPDGTRSGTLTVEQGRIAAIEEGARGRPVAWIAPGLIDLQVNGAFGVDLASEPERLAELAARLPATGVTGFLPTLISSTADAFEDWAARISGAAAAGAGARVLGLHLEGPFLSPERRGAHDGELIRAADAACFERMLALPGLRLVTLAPERPGALERIARLVARGVAVSLGHTAADHDQMRAGFDAGARLVTHLYNAMTGFSHRAPGALGAALLDRRAVLGLIADGVHAAPPAVELAARVAGAGRIALVTDAMAAAGMAPGGYRLAGQAVTVDRDSARLADGTLAGSTLTLDRAVRNMAAWSGLGPEAALRMASEVPARGLGLAAGVIEIGAAADLVLLDGELAVEATLVGGRPVFQR